MVEMFYINSVLIEILSCYKEEYKDFLSRKPKNSDPTKDLLFLSVHSICQQNKGTKFCLYRRNWVG